MPLQVTYEPFVVTAAISRPETMNAINFEVMDRLESLLDELEQKREIRLFVLTGSGNSFISGGDLREFHSIKDAEGAKKMTRRMLSILMRIEALPCFTLAAINGQTYGGGWEISLAFDFRVASSVANIGFTQGAFYLPPGWGGISRLTQTVGRNRALFWLATQAVISAKEASECGLIQQVINDDEFSEKLDVLKESLIQNDRVFIEYLKRKDLQSAQDEIEPFSTFWESEEHMKRVDEFLSRKK